MAENQDHINQLLLKLDALLKRQDAFAKEIDELRGDIHRLQTGSAPVEAGALKEREPVKAPVSSLAAPVMQEEPLPSPEEKTVRKRWISVGLEQFIGENLIGKIGIAVTVIGVGVGAKYAIDNQLINPLTRILLGYLVGLGLLGFAIRLKPSYKNFSAVLLSGSMSILYLMTYLAYSLYGLIPQLPAFGLMVFFTVFTVVAAINYNRQVIAHIGLVGAYAVPFLLSEGSGNMAALFGYMAVINTGILAIAFRKYWKPLYYSSFVITWLIYLAWYFLEYKAATQFGLALAFLGIFFALFYVTFLAYKMIRLEQFGRGNILLLLANAFLFYGVGYGLLADHPAGEQLLGLFTLGNALIHFLVSLFIYQKKLADRSLFYLVSGLVLIFITIAIPVQLDGNWVTMLWAGEAALLFWIGRSTKVAAYEKLAYVLMALAFVSILQDWEASYYAYYPGSVETKITPLLNIHFLGSLLFLASFVFIYRTNKKYEPVLDPQHLLSQAARYAIPAIIIVAAYFSLRMEIEAFWQPRYLDSMIEIDEAGYPTYLYNEDLNSYKIIWILNYSLAFFSILSYLNISRFKNRQLGYVNLLMNGILVFTFLAQGLYFLSELRESYLEPAYSEYFQAGGFNIGIRYISLVCLGLLVFFSYQYIRQEWMPAALKVPFELLLCTAIVWVASSELIHWMDFFDSAQSYKLGLSILWGVIALLFIAVGIWKNKKHLRIGAIVLFSITLIKLFFYDISNLSTIAKTIVLVSLGILLLAISFLYNKYKQQILDENEA
ncbi:MAG: DUF2339 domain-containing protein [Lewinellaceae bacterium]|nr:DUF2339 domain-containing protein [Lewinellaceae bacterium]